MINSADHPTADALAVVSLEVHAVLAFVAKNPCRENRADTVLLSFFDDIGFCRG
jgi:hypothetical protein